VHWSKHRKAGSSGTIGLVKCDSGIHYPKDIERDETGVNLPGGLGVY
jgi:hypothetical protein